MDLAQTRVVLLDAVGTLIYPEPAVADVYFAVGRKFGSRRTAAELQEHFPQALAATETSLATSEACERQRWRSVIDSLFDDVGPDRAALFDELWRHFARPESWRVFDDVAVTWRTLEARGYQVGIASNFDLRLRQVCQGFLPLGACQHLYCSSEIGYAKPSQAFFDAIASRLPASPAEILLVGDDYIRDVVAAQAAGWQALWVRRSGPAAPGAIVDLRQLIDLLSADGPARR